MSLWVLEIQKQHYWQYRAFKSIKIIFYFQKQNLKKTGKLHEKALFCFGVFDS